MKKIASLFVSVILILTGCQKDMQPTTPVARGAGDTATLLAGDLLTYEVITSDTVGWFGMWNLPDGSVATNALDSVTYGSPVYFKSGWRYTFVAPQTPFQPFMSVATHLYNEDIKINIYQNGRLVNSVINDAMQGVAKVLMDVKTDTLTGTATAPVLSYEVLLSERDTSIFEYDGWHGEWVDENGVVTSLNNPLVLNFAIPSGWKYQFRPDRLPFTMRMGASPYLKGGSKMTINFYVNGQLVKTAAARDWIYGMEYTVQ